jgi:glucose-fructose oxidoreductase
MTGTSHLTRRRFLTQTGAAALAAGAFPSIIPRSVFGTEGNVTPGNRIAVACIGVGDRCQDIIGALLNEQDSRIVAVCDVNDEALERTKARIDGKHKAKDCKTYSDFREMLGRKDIDAVVVGSPDHWHVLHALAAVRAGKDVYVEKPLGMSMEQNQVLRKEVQRRSRIFQFGTQQRSERKFRLACELVRNGLIGKLKHINVWAPGSRPGGSIRQIAPPATLDYESWLGPAPRRPYTENLAVYGWDKTWWYISDFALGWIAGWGIHPLDIALWGAGDLARGKVDVEGRGNFPTQGACDTATTWDVNFKFESGVTLRFVGTPNGSPGEKFPQQSEWQQRYQKVVDHGTAFEGTDGWVHVNRESITVHPDTLLEANPADFDLKLARSSNHVRNFLDSVKSRQPAICPIEDAVLSDAFCHVSDVAIRFKRKLVYDTESEKFIGDNEANQRLGVRPMREPWNLNMAAA